MTTIETDDFQIIELSTDDSLENTLSFENLSLIYTPKQSLKLNMRSIYPDSNLKRRAILQNLSGQFKNGLNAILGSSGSGKTSFLNMLAQRIQNKNNLEVNGIVKFNGEEYSYEYFNKFAGYVMQNDYLLPSLTVKEYFQFTADMRLLCSDEEKTQKINQIINMLNLEHCQNTRIGEVLQRGISGGERKRVSIGLELIGAPKVLFLDEPTSGLDSFTSYLIIKTLKNLSVQLNQTIVFTIHQPSSDIWDMFDRVTLLVEGQFVYQGSQDQVLNYFSKIGYSCPIHSNPADYLMYQMNTKKNVDNLIVKYNSILKPTILNELMTTKETKTNSNCSYRKISKNQIQERICTFYMLKKLIERQKKQLSRNKIMINARFIQICAMGLFTGAIFWRLSHADTYADTYQMAQTLYILNLGLFAQSQNPQVITFVQERPVFLKEEGSNLYTTWTYFLSKVLLEIISCSLFAIFDTCIVYWMVGFSASLSKFFFFMLIQVLQSNIGNAFGVLAGALFKEEKLAMIFSLSLFAPQILFAGIFKNRDSYPVWIGWVQYTTPTLYSFDAVIQDQFSDSKNIFNPIGFLHLDINKWKCVGILVALYFIFNVIAFVCLLIKRQRLQ